MHFSLLCRKSGETQTVCRFDTIFTARRKQRLRAERNPVVKSLCGAVSWPLYD